MITHPRRGSLERVMRMVELSPGRTALELAWMSAGGVVGAGGPVGTTTIDPATLVAAVSVGKRLADLVRRGDVRTGPPVAQVRTGGLGYYPVAVRPAPQPQDDRAERHEQVQADLGLCALRELRARLVGADA